MTLTTCSRDGVQLINGRSCEHFYIDQRGAVWQFAPWAHTRTWEPGMQPPIRRVWPNPEAIRWEPVPAHRPRGFLSWWRRTP